VGREGRKHIHYVKKQGGGKKKTRPNRGRRGGTAKTPGRKIFPGGAPTGDKDFSWEGFFHEKKNRGKKAGVRHVGGEKENQTKIQKTVARERKKGGVEGKTATKPPISCGKKETRPTRRGRTDLQGKERTHAGENKKRKKKRSPQGKVTI